MVWENRLLSLETCPSNSSTQIPCSRFLKPLPELDIRQESLQAGSTVEENREKAARLLLAMIALMRSMTDTTDTLTRSANSQNGWRENTLDRDDW